MSCKEKRLTKKDFKILLKRVHKKKIFQIGLFILNLLIYMVPKKYVNSAEVILVLLLIGNFIWDQYINNYFDDIENIRKKDFIDNSFGTKKSLENSNGYYSNDEQKYGIKKMGVNLFENCYFTSNISKIMVTKRLKNDIIICILLFISLAIKFTLGYSAIIPMIQIILSKEFLLESYNLRIYNKQINTILTELCNFYSSINKKAIKELEPELIGILVRYEGILSSHKIILDDDIFNENNERLSKEWAKLKNKYIN